MKNYLKNLFKFLGVLLLVNLLVLLLLYFIIFEYLARFDGSRAYASMVRIVVEMFVFFLCLF